MRATRISLILVCTTLLTVGCTEFPTTVPAPGAEAVLAASARNTPITVMSRNLYLGADLMPVFTVTEPAQIPFKIAELWSDVLANDFPARAHAIAKEVAIHEPQLIGLQEVARYQLAAPGHPSVVLDYLGELLGALGAQGLNYSVVATVDNFQLQLPIVTPTGLGAIDFLQRDVIIARSDVEVSNSIGANYQTSLPLLVGGLQISVLRGWTAVDATRQGQTIRFVNTHLEAFHPLVNGAQAQELAGILAMESRSVVLVGDINSGPGDPDNRPGYAIFQQAGFSDSWTQANPGTAGFTCCFADILSQTNVTPDQRIDVVLFRQPSTGTGVDHVSATTVGGSPGDRIWSTYSSALLWPSDHLGVLATLHYRDPRPVGGRR
jgi:endonuclease/exonuclease/phosphatase family metal-dependent hydrolase